MSRDMSPDAFFDTLTGFDEIAIAKAFGKDIATLADTDAMGFLRSLVFVALRREGQDDKSAKASIMEMPLGDVRSYFTETAGDENTDPKEEQPEQ